MGPKHNSAEPSVPRARWLWVALVTLLGCIHLAGLGNAFVWDDLLLVVENDVVQGQNPTDAFLTAPSGRPLGTGALYRPLQTLSFMSDLRVFGLSAAGFRLTNVVMHCLLVFLVAVLVRRWSDNDVVGLLTAAIFAIHPSGVEVVDYIGSRGDVMAALFGVGSLVCLQSPRFGLRYVAAPALVVAAFLSKENGIMVAGFAALGALFLPEKSNRRGVFVLLAAVVGFFVLRALIEVSSQARTLSVIGEASWPTRLATIPLCLSEYLGILLFPHDLHMERHFVFDGASLKWLIGIAVPLIVGGLALRRVLTRFESLMFAWFFVGLVPFLHIVAPLSATVAERWLYLPSIGFWAAVCSLGVRSIGAWGRNARYLGVALVVVWMGYLGFATVDRIGDWRTSTSLFEHDVQFAANSFLVHNNLGVLAMERGDYTQAQARFEQSIQTHPGQLYGLAHSNLGEVLEILGQENEAARHYYQAIKLSREALAYEKLARAFLRRNEIDGARSLIDEALRWHPRNETLLRMSEQISRQP